MQVVSFLLIPAPSTPWQACHACHAPQHHLLGTPRTGSLGEHVPSQASEASPGSSSRDGQTFGWCWRTCSSTVGPPPPFYESHLAPYAQPRALAFCIRAGWANRTKSGSMPAMHALPWAGLGCACGQELHFKMLTASFHSSIFCLVVRVVEGAVCLPLEAPSIRAARLASCMQPTAHHWGQVRGVLPAAEHSVNDLAAQSQQAVPCAAAAVHAH